MSKLSPSLPMSHIIANDAPLLSPVTDSWDNHLPMYSPSAEHLNFGYYNIPPSPQTSVGSGSSDSPVPTARMLKMRMSPDSMSDSDGLCLPTHQLFDFPQSSVMPTPPSPRPSSPKQPRLSICINPSLPAKRSASPTPSLPKKTRTVGERINSKDFIPPDVSGLSKREARLVKNRAAAFLSRQRKREEFECMEVRVAELEQENARLLALAQNGNDGSCSRPTTNSDAELVSEVEQLRARLAAAEARERELNAELRAKSASQEIQVKAEPLDHPFSLPTPPRSSTGIQSAHKSAASLGLMVLLCALPSLLSMPTQSALPSAFSLPTPQSATSPTFDYNPFMASEYDWSRPSMDIDGDGKRKLTAAPSSTASYTRRLGFSEDGDLGALGGLGGLDVSFDASPSETGKIRVRIHPSSSASSRANSPASTASYSSSNQDSSSSSSSSSLGLMWPSESDTAFQPSEPFGSAASSFSLPNSIISGDPFLGSYGMSYPPTSQSYMFGQTQSSSVGVFSPVSDPAFGGFGSEYTLGDSTTEKRRVRIALKRMPAAGGEGGEWEVQLC